MTCLRLGLILRAGQRTTRCCPRGALAPRVVGIDLTQIACVVDRSPTAQLYANNGAVFWTEPDEAPNFEQQPKGTPVARLTVKTGNDVQAVVNAQGRSTQAGADWEQRNIKFHL